MSEPRPTQAHTSPLEEPTFEAAMKRLSDIVQRLERGDLPLEESLLLFEEGMRLSASSQARLDAAQKRVEQLLAVDEQGRPRKAPFDLHEDEDPGSDPGA